MDMNVNVSIRRVAFDASGVQVVGREFDETPTDVDFYIRLHAEDALVDTVEISDQARAAAKTLKAA